MMRLQNKGFWKRWFVHSLIMWFFANALHFIDFLFKKSRWGDFLHYPDGSTVSAWDRFTQIFLNGETLYIIFITIFLIELNYQLFFKKRLWLFVLTSTAAGIAVSFLLYYNYMLRHGQSYFSMEPAFIVTPYAFAYPLLLDYFKKRILKAEHLYERSTAELNVLRTQIHPHFFFNTLNTIYGLALNEKAEGTASAIEKLSDMMRYVLKEGSEDFVALNSELKFISQYIELQRMRLPQSSDMQFDSQIETDNSHALIVPLLMLPVIENAFQYSVSTERKSFIYISIMMREKKLELHVKNSINPSRKKGNGIGLANMKRRLEIFYPGRHSLKSSATAEEYTCTLEITL